MGIKRVLVPCSCCRLRGIIYVKSLEVYCKCLRNETLAVININILGLMTVSSYSIGSFFLTKDLLILTLLYCSACMCAVLSCFSRVQLFATPRTVALQAPLSMGFPRQEYWSGLPCPPPGDLPDPGIKPVSPALQVFTTQPPGKP